ncbi:MAG: hypothetical protein MJ185_03985 [Treponema sp.]|nr:hypothetical protein [Treponema sp.]
MDDNEYYAMMRRQYSHTDSILKKNKSKTEVSSQIVSKTPGTYKELEKKYGHEDAEMFIERNESD